MWFNVDWNALLQGQMPSWWRRPRFVAWLNLLVSPVAWLHAQMVELRSRLVYELSFTGQTMSLEHALNDRFDNIDRQIWIENHEDPTQIHIYRKEALAPQFFIYRKWNSGQAYLIGQFATAKGRVWKALADNDNSAPSNSNTDWENHGPMLYIRRKEESQVPWHFTVWVPTGLVFDEAELRALVDRYRLASRRYNILTF